MPAQTNLNVPPYYDDFDPNKNFYRVLYKAGYPVQARELTQSQSILQDQIEKLGSVILKDGDKVVPGEFSLGVPISYVRLSTFTQGATVDEFVGYRVTGVTSGVTAFINYAEAATEDDDATLFVNYEGSGLTAEYTTFIEGETLESDHPNLYTAVVGVTTISKPIDTPAIGQGSLFTVSGGSYFVNGFIVRNDSQTISLDKYGTNPTYEVGFLVSEEFITSSDDESLLDNSQGSSNFAAPGADRLKINLTLHKRIPGSTDPNFIQLASIQEGNLLGKPDQTIKWDWLYDILAKRSFDADGDYIVKDFSIKTMEYWNDDLVEGLFDVDPATDTYPPVPGSPDTERLTPEEADNKYVVEVGPGRAYVQGYEVGFRNPIYLYGDKPRNTNFIQNTLTQVTPGYNINVTSVYGAPDFQNIDGDAYAEAFDDVILYRSFTDGFVGESVDANGRPLNIGNKPWITYHIIADSDIGSISEVQPEAVVFQEGRSCVITSDTDFNRGDTIGGATAVIVSKIEPVPSGVMKPRYLTPEARVDGQNGYYGYNSTYSMGVMTSNYFTQLANVPVTNGSTAWTVGDLVTGEESAAIGVVEEGSTDSILIVSNVVGDFQAGEEVVQGDKVSRILKEGEVVGFHFTDAGDLSAAQSIQVSAIGSTLQLLVTTDFTYDATTQTLIPTESGINKLLNFPYPEGSALSTKINYDVETDNGIKGYALLFDFKITHTLSKTKALFSSLADLNDFSADISVQNNVDAEIIDIANRSLFSGDEDTNFITCDNLSGDPTDQLVAGDIITLVDDEGLSINRVVLFTTRPVGYGELRSKSRIYLTTTIPNKVTGKTVQRVRVNAKGTPDENLLFQLPQKVIASLESDPLSTRISYQVYREFLLQVTGGSTTFTLTTNDSNETFVNDPNRTTITISKNSGNPADPNNLEGRSLTATATLQDNGRKAVYTFNNAYALPGDMVLKILVPVFVNNATAKRKVLIEDEELIIPQADSGVKVISLGKADLFQVKTITMLREDGSQADISDNYVVDNGQRDNVYDIARLVLKSGRPVANNIVTITFDYFQHSNEGDFFSVDSYTDDNGVGYRNVPVYMPQTGINRNNNQSTVIQLKDVVDFRPVVNTADPQPSVIATITDGQGQQGSKNFLDTTFEGSQVGAPAAGDAFVPRLPIPGTQFQCDVEYYLPRIDSLFIEKDGSLNLVKGEAADMPVAPQDLATALRLFNIHLPPFTFAIKNAKNEKFNYKRYRMRDIADMNRRIDRIEELVTLSLLEQSALNMSVRDAVTGLERFKNGIVVDTFRDHKRGDVNSSQYRNSIDPVHTHLRAAHFTDQVELEETNQTVEEKLGNGYRKTGPLLTVNYESKRVIQNPLATRFINLQPYTVFTYDGNMELTPSVDTWQETNRLPDLIIEDNNLFNAFQGFSDEMAESGIGTQWGDWETTGTSRTSETFTIRNSEDNPNAVQNAVNAVRIGGGQVNVTQWAGDVLGRGGTPPIRITNTTVSTTERREQTMTRINVGTARIENTSYGDRVVDVKLATQMRSTRVVFQAYRLKPNTRYYAFFDDIEVSAWCSPDTMETNFPDNKPRYVGLGGRTNRGFGLPLLSDGVGTLTGVFVIPNGRAPVEGSVFTTIENVQYQTSGPTRSFGVGTRVFRVTSSETNVKDPSQVEGFAESSFYAQGVLQDKQETVVSTRIPSFSHTKTVVDSQTRVTESEEQTANYFDPVAQTFMIDAVHADGIFMTELDVFFRTKDSTQGVEAYLTSTDGQVPTEDIIPFSRVVKNTDTTLRVMCELAGLADESTSIAGGVTVTGSISGATGTVKSTQVFEPEADNPTTNVNNTVYNLLLDNYVGEFVPGEGLTVEVSPANPNTFTIVADEYAVTRVDVRDMGGGYSTGTTVEFSPPELPGGVTATGTVSLGPNGEVYEVTLDDPGSGYIRIPSATILDAENGNGGNAVLIVRAIEGAKAVDMGVCTSDDATAPTKFKFQAPVYLLGDTNYSFVVKAPTSLNFTIWTSKLGENMLGTELRVVEQPNMGSLFMSQNGALWTEDQTQDIKFTLWRAEFETLTDGIVKLQNAPLTYKYTQKDPIETNATPASDVTSTIFGDNPAICRVYMYNHGLLKNDMVAIRGVIENPGGIPNEQFNTLHTVLDASINTFTIKLPTDATTSGKSGGNNVTATFNRPYEVINIVTGAMTFGSARLSTVNRATEAAGLSLYNAPYQYRLDTPVSVNLMDSYYYPGARQVAHPINEALYNDSEHLQNRKSLETTITMTTFNSKVSPVIDLDRTNATVIRNLIDNPKMTDDIFGPGAATITTDAAFSGLAKNATIDLDALPVRIDEFNSNTRKIRVSGKNVRALSASPAITSGAMNLTRITEYPSAYFVPETSNNGSVYAKWISRLFIFENPCDGLEVKISSIFYTTDSLKLYFRPRNIGFDGDIADVNWIPFNGTGLPDNVDKIAPRSSTTVDPEMVFASDWQSLTWTVQDVAKFDGIAIKVTMTVDNPAHAPLLDDIQVVASE